MVTEGENIAQACLINHSLQVRFPGINRIGSRILQSIYPKLELLAQIKLQIVIAFFLYCLKFAFQLQVFRSC